MARIFAVTSCTTRSHYRRRSAPRTGPRLVAPRQTDADCPKYLELVLSANRLVCPATTTRAGQLRATGRALPHVSSRARSTIPAGTDVTVTSTGAIPGHVAPLPDTAFWCASALRPAPATHAISRRPIGRGTPAVVVRPAGRPALRRSAQLHVISPRTSRPAWPACPRSQSSTHFLPRRPLGTGLI